MKRKKVFELPYIGIHENPDFDLLYGKFGEFSVIIKMKNPVMSYSGAPDHYDEAHGMFLNIIKTLGEKMYIQKQDIISRTQYKYEPAEDFLQDEYNKHFADRSYLKIETYLIITRQVKRKALYVYDHKALIEFKQNVGKVIDILTQAGCRPVTLRKREIDNLVMRTLNIDFHNEVISVDNMVPNDQDIKVGERRIKCLSLINIDTVDMPSDLPTHVTLSENSSLMGFPVDMFSFLLKVPNFDTILFNQVIEIPGQMGVLNKLELKKKRHSGIPDPANLLAVQDIEALLTDVARDNQLLVNCHFNIIISAHADHIQKAANFVEGQLFQHSIIASKNAYNQLELFRTALPGNTTELEDYDMFLTTAEAALCLFFKEALAEDEVSDFRVRFTDRQGIPITVDLMDDDKKRITNRNKFVLGPSGTGKSYLINSIIEQYMLHNMDIVIVDTGHSYSGYCAYYGGKYITYSEKDPITMNPFAVTQEELNIEKKDFINTLICLLWKGADGDINQLQRDVIDQCIDLYYQSFFNKPLFGGLTDEQEESLQVRFQNEMILLDVSDQAKANLLSVQGEINLQVDREFAEKITGLTKLYSTDDSLDVPLMLAEEKMKIQQHYLNARLQREIESIKEQKAKEIFTTLQGEALAQAKDEFVQRNVTQLNFNSFYEFSLFTIPEIREANGIPFDFPDFKFVLKKFYKGGAFDTMLNEEADASLFTERFIVFEIDSIKEHKVLFPIVTLIIMDVFIQKMRNREGFRKALIIEEAWKAIASPLMAGYILYLYKTVRKFWGEAVVVTQELNDIIGNAVVKDSIINNSDTTLLLDQSKFKDNFDEIASLLSLNSVEKSKILTVNKLDNKQGRSPFKEVYIKRGSSGEVYGVEVSLSQYFAYTTEKPEKRAIEAYVRLNNNDYKEGLKQFVLDLKASNMSMSQFVRKVNSNDQKKEYLEIS